MIRPTSPVAHAVIALAMGLGVGVLTSFLQPVLDFPWLAMANAVSPWLTTAFVAGALQPRMRTAVWVGMVATLMQVIGYHVTAELRGFNASTTFVVLWSVCALIGGPVFGAAGQAWRRATPAGMGAAMLVSAYAAEALVSYQLHLDYTSTAVFFGVIALFLAVGLTWHRQQYAGLVRWIIPACAAGATGHLLLGLVV